ncbi:nucleotide disphospho-sugar-binding domain-containing protein [Prauserella cavernicola]|uniref:DUF1205 domain-containing protein n=1 Tax=Prauserella cavernicola TaxID=2800127 RepID=A0A934V8K8_9PSEU|nr:nucleotide disphospho-sugar-binding domain-containing protein [Prauserella cavernicola]MBK1787873.1 DUF1205 domain-containing protein [Prauserella cavernicola]
MRVLITSVALPGHFFPLVPLAWALRSSGHDVLVAVPETFVPTAARSGLPVVSCVPEADFVRLSADGGGDRIPRGQERSLVHGRFFGRLAAAGLRGVRSLAESWKPDLVLSERAEFAGRIAAAERDIPFVELQWGVARLDDYVAGATVELAAELAAAGQSALPEPAEVLCQWPPSLRLPHTGLFRTLRYVPYNGDAHVPAWALGPAGARTICVTMGTLIPRLGPDGVRELILPMLESLAELDVELLVAVDDAVVAGWPRLPDAVRFAGRLPLAQVLPHCSAAISHGGEGSTLTAFVSGCPQLILPQFDDQFDNAAAVEQAGAGLGLPPDELTPAAVARQCRKLLDDPRFARSAERVAAEIAAQPSVLEIVGTLEKLTG